MAQMTLQQARVMLGWSMTKLAQEAGVGISTINDLEKGGNLNPGYQIVMRVVQALQRGGLKGMKPEDIFPVEPKAVA